MMTKEEAQEHFAEYLEIECPNCKAPKGVLCDTVAVWIHFDRYIHKEIQDKNLIDEAIEILEHALNLRMHAVGRDEIINAWRDWDTKCETFLRRVVPDPREKYMHHNETP